MILRDGFRDGHGKYMTDADLSGVWLSDRPLDCNEGAWGETLLAVEIVATPDEWSFWEVVEDRAGATFREYLIPAATLNARAAVSLSRDDEL